MINLNFTFLLMISSKGLFFVSFIFSFLLSLDGIFLLVKWIFVLLGQTYMFLFFFLGCDLYVALLFPWVRLICPFFFLGGTFVLLFFPWVRLICPFFSWVGHLCSFSFSLGQTYMWQQTIPSRDISSLFCNVQRTLLHSKSWPFPKFHNG